MKKVYAGGAPPPGSVAVSGGRSRAAASVELVEVGALLEPRPLRVADGELVGPDLSLPTLFPAPDRRARVAAVLRHDVVVQVELRAPLVVALALPREVDDALEGRHAGL